jgi:hypothetical protein
MCQKWPLLPKTKLIDSFYISMFYLLLTRICHSSNTSNWAESALVWRPLLLESESWLLLVVLLLLGKPSYSPTFPSLVPVKAFQTIATVAAVGVFGPQHWWPPVTHEDKGLTPSCCRATHAACWTLASLSFKALV